MGELYDLDLHLADICDAQAPSGGAVVGGGIAETGEAFFAAPLRTLCEAP